MKRQFQTARRAGLLAGVAALALSGVAHAADATTTPPADGVTSLEEVVVTAQKRKTNLQDTPIAISAMDSEALKARHVQSVEDLGDGSIPSLRVAPFFARKSALTIGMRGIGALATPTSPRATRLSASMSTASIWAVLKAWARRSTTWSASRS